LYLSYKIIITHEENHVWVETCCENLSKEISVLCWFIFFTKKNFKNIRDGQVECCTFVSKLSVETSMPLKGNVG